MSRCVPVDVEDGAVHEAWVQDGFAVVGADRDIVQVPQAGEFPVGAYAVCIDDERGAARTLRIIGGRE